VIGPEKAVELKRLIDTVAARLPDNSYLNTIRQTLKDMNELEDLLPAKKKEVRSSSAHVHLTDTTADGKPRRPWQSLGLRDADLIEQKPTEPGPEPAATSPEETQDVLPIGLKEQASDEVPEESAEIEDYE
jgi:hypothetical protein